MLETQSHPRVQSRHALMIVGGAFAADERRRACNRQLVIWRPHDLLGDVVRLVLDRRRRQWQVSPGDEEGEMTVVVIGAKAGTPLKSHDRPASRTGI
jgi:hypothetical protein